MQQPHAGPSTVAAPARPTDDENDEDEQQLDLKLIQSFAE
jgi:hypothetical protein